MYNKDLDFRYAKREDTALILQLSKNLLIMKKCLTKSLLMKKHWRNGIFDKQKAEVIFAVVNGKEVGFALFFHNFLLSWVEPEFTLKICM